MNHPQERLRYVIGLTKGKLRVIIVGKLCVQLRHLRRRTRRFRAGPLLVGPNTLRRLSKKQFRFFRTRSPLSPLPASVGGSFCHVRVWIWSLIRTMLLHSLGEVRDTVPLPQALGSKPIHEKYCLTSLSRVPCSWYCVGEAASTIQLLILLSLRKSSPLLEQFARSTTSTLRSIQPGYTCRNCISKPGKLMRDLRVG